MDEWFICFCFFASSKSILTIFGTKSNWWLIIVQTPVLHTHTHTPLCPGRNITALGQTQLIPPTARHSSLTLYALLLSFSKFDFFRLLKYVVILHFFWNYLATIHFYNCWLLQYFLLEVLSLHCISLNPMQLSGWYKIWGLSLAYARKPWQEPHWHHNAAEALCLDAKD